MKDSAFGKPIIAVVNSFTQFVPGHVNLKYLGQLVAREIEAAGGVAKEFNTTAVDDGIAMGQDGRPTPPSPPAPPVARCAMWIRWRTS